MFPFSKTEAVTNKIIANVDDQIISSFELKNRIKTVIFLGNQELNQIAINKAKNESMRHLIDSKLKKNEIRKFNIDIEENDRVRDYIQRLSYQFDTDVPGLKKKFNNAEIDYELFLEDIKIEFAWRQLIYRIYNKEVESNINKDQIEKELKEIIKNQKNIIEFKLGEIEIFLEENSQVEEKIKEIKQQISEIGFENTAIKFSSSSSSLEGGNIGWINSESLSEKIRKLVAPLKINGVSDPLIQPKSVLFLKLLDKRGKKVENINLEEMRNKIIQDKENEILSLFASSHLTKIRNTALIDIK